MDDINELVDFNADIVTRLLIVFCPLILSIRRGLSSDKHKFTSTMSMTPFTAVITPSRPGMGDILAATINTSSDVFRPLYTSSRLLRVEVSDIIRAAYRKK